MFRPKKRVELNLTKEFRRAGARFLLEDHLVTGSPNAPEESENSSHEEASFLPIKS